MPTLYAMPGTCALAPNIAVAWLGAPVEVRTIPHGDNRKPEYLAINPHGKVPALQFDDGDVLTEAAAILAWLGAEYGKDSYARDTTLGRKEAEALSYMVSDVHGAFGAHFAPARFADGPCQDDAKRHAYAQIAKHYRFMAEHVERNGGEWYLGKRSFADAYLYVLTRWADQTPVPLSDTPALVAHRTRMEADEKVRLALARQDMKPLG